MNARKNHRKLGQLLLAIFALSFAIGRSHAEGLAETDLNASGAQAAAAADVASREKPCSKNDDWESRVFILRIAKASPDNDASREVRIRFGDCGLYAETGVEERWFSDTQKTGPKIGFAASSHVGSDQTAVGFFQSNATSGDLGKMCIVAADLGTHPNFELYKAGFTLENVHFNEVCSGRSWNSTVQVIPLSF